jgi:hypothetical protein
MRDNRACLPLSCRARTLTVRISIIDVSDQHFQSLYYKFVQSMVIMVIVSVTGQYMHRGRQLRKTLRIFQETSRTSCLNPDLILTLMPSSEKN